MVDFSPLTRDNEARFVAERHATFVIRSLVNGHETKRNETRTLGSTSTGQRAISLCARSRIRTCIYLKITLECTTMLRRGLFHLALSCMINCSNMSTRELLCLCLCLCLCWTWRSLFHKARSLFAHRQPRRDEIRAHCGNWIFGDRLPFIRVELHLLSLIVCLFVCLLILRVKKQS